MTPQDIGAMLERSRAGCEAITAKFAGETITYKTKEIIRRDIAMLEMEWKLDGTTVCPMLAFERAAKLQHLRAYLEQFRELKTQPFRMLTTTDIKAMAQAIAQ